MLFNLYNNKAKVKDVPVTITYDKDQIQNLNVFKITIFFKNLVKIYKRIKFNYFNRKDWAVFLLLHFYFFIFTICYGGYNYIYYFFYELICTYW